MSNNKKPRCPACDTAKHVSPFGLTGAMFYCSKCHGTFEPDGEGGVERLSQGRYLVVPRFRSVCL